MTGCDHLIYAICFAFGYFSIYEHEQFKFHAQLTVEREKKFYNLGAKVWRNY